MDPNGPGPHAAHDAQLERLRSMWNDALGGARSAGPGSIAFARLADHAAACVGAWLRAGRRDEARAVTGDALAVMRQACRAERDDLARHLAFGRVLELAAAVEGGAGDARSSFDALRAAISVVGRFAPALRERAADPLARIAIASGLLRPITTAARMVDEPSQRRAAFAQAWDEARSWAHASRGAADHATAIEAAVLAAFDLAVEEHADRASDCLERCEDLRPHLEELANVRGEDAVVRQHRAALARLSADAWARLGDRAEARTLLEEAARHLDAAAGGTGIDPRTVEAQRAQLAAQRAALDERGARPTAGHAQTIAG
jgi:hypothetical protein